MIHYFILVVEINVIDLLCVGSGSVVVWECMMAVSLDIIKLSLELLELELELELDAFSHY